MLKGTGPIEVTAQFLSHESLYTPCGTNDCPLPLAPRVAGTTQLQPHSGLSSREDSGLRRHLSPRGLCLDERVPCQRGSLTPVSGRVSPQDLRLRHATTHYTPATDMARGLKPTTPSARPPSATALHVLLTRWPSARRLHVPPTKLTTQPATCTSPAPQPRPCQLAVPAAQCRLSCFNAPSANLLHELEANHIPPRLKPLGAPMDWWANP